MTRSTERPAGRGRVGAPPAPRQQGHPAAAPSPQGHPAATPAAPAPARRGSAVRRALAAAVPPLVLVAAGLVVWQWFVVATGVRPQVLPSPLRVVVQGWAAREQIWANTLPTLQVTAVGFAVSLALGWAIAVAVDFSPWLRRALTPLLVASQTLPIVAVAPTYSAKIAPVTA